jgi:hypothetical protein
MQRLFRNTRRLFLAAALTAVLAAAAPARADQPLPDCHVLSIGVENYPTQVPLPGCANDARYLADRFQKQEGKLFGKVHTTVLVNDQATEDAISQGMGLLYKQGKAGDWVVFIASGHNSGTGDNWGFLTRDEKAVTGWRILDMADTAASQGRKVLILVDACYSGQFRLMAQKLLVKYDDPTKGGVLLMLASTPGQPSVAFVGLNYSAFSKALDEALAGHADYNGDGVVTLQEVRTYVFARVHAQLAEAKSEKKQDAVIECSLSLSGGLALAKTQPALLNLKGTLTPQSEKDEVRPDCFCQSYKVHLEKGVTYVIDMRSLDLDSYLRLESEFGERLAQDDDSGPGYHNARIVFTATQSGTYRVIATTFGGTTTGSFTLNVRKAP